MASASTPRIRTALAALDDRRAEPRWPGERADFDLLVAGKPASLVDFSPVGMGVLLDGSPAAEGLVLVDLVRRGVPFAQVGLAMHRVRPVDCGVLLGGRITSMVPVGSPSSRGDEPGNVATLRSGGVLGDLLAQLRGKRFSTTLDVDGEVVGAAIVEGGEVVTVHAGTEVLASALGRVVAVRVVVHGSCFELVGVLEPLEAGCARLRPTLARSVSRRVADRAAFGARRAVLRWEHPLRPGEHVQAVALDFSPFGLSLRLAPGVLPPPPGGLATLHVDGLAVRVVTSVRHVERNDGGETRVGLEMAAPSAEDRRRLAAAWNQARFPRLVSRSEADPEAVVELLRKSGYLDLRRGTGPAEGWHVAPGDERLTVDLVYESRPGELVGHISCSRIYRRTFLSHQLATLSDDKVMAMDCRRALYLDIAGWLSVLLEGGCMMAYFDRAKRWHQLFFQSFVEWAGSDELALLMPWDRYERASVPGALAVASDVVVRELREGDTEAAMRLVNAAVPPLARRGLDLDGDRLCVDDLVPEHREAGLERARRSFVAVRGGRLLGLAVCETGSRRLSLFNLLNMARVFFADGADADPQRALLEHVTGFYTARGVSDPIVLATPGTLRAAEASGLRLAETMGSIVISEEGMKQYRNFLHFQLGRFEMQE